ncbi:aldo/keto reductase [Chthonobacter albigriseus]|uniref:aldo/keto reductase n=1 Tax=Chthonobacter albigriseus TaxID=1683161 RepID=UPI0015EE50A2|nr:aldo/keto reductase [Chthonobacter albigriseus]
MSSLPFAAKASAGRGAEVPPSDLPLRPLGRSGVQLPALGLGCAGLGELFTPVPEAESDAILQTAWNAGIRYFDTSPWYGRGKSEHRVGRFLWDKPRDAAIVSTKVGRLFRRRADVTREIADQWLAGLPFEPRFDYTYDGIMRSYEDSQQRLGLDVIDMLVIHDLDHWHHDEAAFETRLRELAQSGWRALSELRACGAVKAVGAGINQCGFTGRFLDLMPLDFFLVALRLTLLEHAPFLADELPRLRRDGVGIVAGGVFSSGLGASGPVPGALFNYAPAGPDALARAAAIETVCQAHGVTLAAAALHYPLRFSEVTSVIPGAVAADQVAAIVTLYGSPPPEALWTDLSSACLVSA